MIRIIVVSYILILFNFNIGKCQSLLTPFELDSNKTATYQECIDFYKTLARKSSMIHVLSGGHSDVSFPIHIVVIDKDGLTDPKEIRNKKRSIILINNGIHPGEPEGIDASMIFARKMVLDKASLAYLNRVTIIIIPIYNIGGSLLRNSTSRVNQNGPMAYGFRGNRQNLDLNRDFIKCDSKNAKTFSNIFNQWNPDILIDNHTSDGADYTYNITLLASQRNKLNVILGDYMYNKFIPSIYASMNLLNEPLVPYVNVEDIPDHGIYDFMDSPRFSSGYAAIHNSFAFMIETHMLKSYHLRVKATITLMQQFMYYASSHAQEIIDTRADAFKYDLHLKVFPISWKFDETQYDSIWFSGYEAEYKPSQIHSSNRLIYNRTRPYVKKIPFYNKYVPQIKVEKPKFYIIPQSYDRVIELLKINGVKMTKLNVDTMIFGSFYKILHYKTTDLPYENHYLHSKIEVEKINMKYPYFKGDYLIHTDQNNIRFIIETLEPQAPDSYFAWNYFDGILMRKEYFSDYLFEDKAYQLLEENAELRNLFNQYINSDSLSTKNLSDRLEFIYNHSVYCEPYFNIYPVGRIEY